MPAPLAVFTRNHAEHMVQAAQISGNEPDREITFRSMQRWAQPANELNKGREPVVYIAVVDQGDLVRYRARLRRVLTDPHAEDSTVKGMLNNATESTAAEGLWPGTRTLYAISNVEQVHPPFPQTSLKKFRDGEPIAGTYSRAYCLVQEKP